MLPFRLHARFPCRIRASLRCPGRSQPLAVEVRDIGMGGALIRSEVEVSDLRVELDLPAGEATLAIPASVSRRLGADPGDPDARLYALSFHLPFSEKHKLLRLVDRIRSSPRR